MTDLEISKALALAIGWHQSDLQGSSPSGGQIVRCEDDWLMVFDYRDWAVSGPIAERFDCFPMISGLPHRDWFSRACRPLWDSRFHYADTPQKAIALAVIAGAKP